MIYLPDEDWGDVEKVDNGETKQKSMESLPEINKDISAQQIHILKLVDR